ncbi:hypothetical protein NVP1152O_097 [Vibrio phage 1.152.O._10N.222.46.E1]|uniref:Uncharacterized protein n=4 Tax=Nahantvirus 49C7 TaxID=2846601 RepID=A0A2I7RBH8_9CAUD|nr:hypothetical protein NVP1025O_096 [Vibrio phage 1.025.O._10N.222.46.B6]AUR90829.1 hypothetical protein NVP1150O_096 [Vibrio phage 1.150.O._10N.222.46.A6]AUR91002.1 hypothetical protein NVP1152O_097 [Vibrio phage 1.152.O._10N.222.46.E1]AUS02470.1 hypothetical protein NVP2130O_096 [Vibrio phage 2.130.O._10N.222.46.C2]
MFTLYLEPKGKEIRQFRVYAPSGAMVCASRNRAFNTLWLDRYDAHLSGKCERFQFTNMSRPSTECEFLGEYDSREDLVNAIEMFALMEDVPYYD